MESAFWLERLSSKTSLLTKIGQAMRVRNIVYWIYRFSSRSGGASAVEFAIIFPVMMVMLLGSVGVGQAISLNRKVTLLTRSLADIVAQSQTITNADLANIFAAARTIVVPFNTAPLKMVVASLWTDAAGATTVDWSYAQNTAVLGKNTSYNLPADIKINETSVIMARVSYPYTVTIGQAIIGNTIDMSEQIYMRPRAVERIPEPAI
jgi:Flp pilus assembly protein TadG